MIRACGILVAAIGIASAAPADHKPGKLPIGIDDLPYEAAVKKLAIPFRNDLPQIFVSGDSISVGYGAALKLALKDRMNVVHRRDLPTRFPAVPSNNYSGAGPSVIQLARAMLSLPDYKPDVMLLNFGLHDTAGGAPAYEKNLKALLVMMRQQQVKLVWVQTTAKWPGHRDNVKIGEFNRISARLMAAAGVPVIDLNAFSAQLIAKHGPAKILRPDQVHFTPFAAAQQGQYIASQLKEK